MLSELRVAKLRARGYRVGNNVYIGKGVRIDAEDVTIGDNCYLLDGVSIYGKSVTLGENVCLFPRVHIYVKDRIKIGRHSKISRDCILKGNSITIGRDLWCNEFTEIGGGGWSSPEADVNIGDFMHIGRGVHLNVCKPITLAGYSGIGMDCMIFTHGAGQGQSVLDGYGFTEAPVVINRHVSLYSRSIVAPGTIIHEGVTVATMSYVKGELEEKSLYAGIPAVRKKSYTPLASFKQKELILEMVGDLGNAVRFRFSGEDVEAAVNNVDLGSIYGRNVNGRARRKANKEAQQIIDCLIDLNNMTISGKCTQESEFIRDNMRRHGIILNPVNGYELPLLNPFELWENGYELL